jgi:hypothetical protein
MAIFRRLFRRHSRFDSLASLAMIHYFMPHRRITLHIASRLLPPFQHYAFAGITIVL